MMNTLVKSLSKVSIYNAALKTANHHLKSGWNQNRFCYTFSKSFTPYRSFTVLKSAYFFKSNCNKIKYYSTHPTETEISLANVLEKEIVAEQDLQKTKTIPSKVDDFEVALNGSEVTFTRQLPNETIKINFSVNNSVESVNEHDEELSPELRSKPTFWVLMETSHGTLGLHCSFLPEVEDDEEMNDVFGVNEICVYKGTKTNADYVVAAHLIDYDIYNLLMDWLDEKGITNEFVQKLSDFSSTYEHNLYISILSELRKFVSHSEL